jgi:hypothetical protein
MVKYCRHLILVAVVDQLGVDEMVITQDAVHVQVMHALGAATAADMARVMDHYCCMHYTLL